ncbi:hypothetical protein D3C84_905100 [compost metagenome]
MRVERIKSGTDPLNNIQLHRHQWRTLQTQVDQALQLRHALAQALQGNLARHRQARKVEARLQTLQRLVEVGMQHTGKMGGLAVPGLGVFVGVA